MLLAVLTAHLVQGPLMEYVSVQADFFITIIVWLLALQDSLELMENVRPVRVLALLALALLTSV